MPDSSNLPSSVPTSSSPLWSMEERVLFSALRPCLSTKEIHLVFAGMGYDRSEEAIDRRGRRVGISFIGFTEPDTSELDEQTCDIIAGVLEGTRGTPPGEDVTEPTAAPSFKSSVSSGEILARLEKIASELPPPKPPPPPVRSSGTSLVLLLSDLHFGKQTPTFDLATARERIVGIPDRLASYMPSDTDEVLVALGGDVIEGEDIYPTQNCHIECPVIEQAHHAAEAIWLMIRKFVDQGKKVRVVTCPGNHGRMSRTANEKSNWDNVVYQELGLIARMVGDPNISIEVNFEPFIRFPVRDKWGLMYHQGTKHTGTPAMQVRLAGWLQTKPFQFFLHGHWHQWEIGTILGRPVVKNGSLPGGDDLAETMGVMDPPRQAYFFIKEKEPLFGFSYLEW